MAHILKVARFFPQAHDPAFMKELLKYVDIEEVSPASRDSNKLSKGARVIYRGDTVDLK